MLFVVGCVFCQFVAGLETERLDDVSVVGPHNNCLRRSDVRWWSGRVRSSIHAPRHDAGCDCVFA